MAIYKTTCFGDVNKIKADFAQSADPILANSGEDGEWVATGKQVADYGHSAEDAMRDYLCTAYEIAEDDDNSYDRIHEAVEQMETERQLGRVLVYWETADGRECWAYRLDYDDGTREEGEVDLEDDAGIQSAVEDTIYHLDLSMDSDDFGYDAAGGGCAEWTA